MYRENMVNVRLRASKWRRLRAIAAQQKHSATALLDMIADAAIRAMEREKPAAPLVLDSGTDESAASSS